jgi:hypothetical protein
VRNRKEPPAVQETEQVGDNARMKVELPVEADEAVQV